jgi:hypothetical protein
VQQQEARIRNLYDGLAKMGWSQALADIIREEEAKLRALKRSAAPRAKTPAKVLPHPRIVEGYLRNFLTLLDVIPSQRARSWPATSSPWCSPRERTEAMTSRLPSMSRR